MYIYILGLKVPPLIKRRGRPKGRDLTTIGLPAKKKARTSDKLCVRSFLLHSSEKEKSKCYCSYMVIFTLLYGIFLD